MLELLLMGGDTTKFHHPGNVDRHRSVELESNLDDSAIFQLDLLLVHQDL